MFAKTLELKMSKGVVSCFDILGVLPDQSGRRNTDGLLAHRRASSPQTGYYPAHRRATSFEVQN